ncbi:hypothetical protein AAC387_Pa08g1603 [Persea americana]
MHEMVPGKQFDRYHELVQHAFGEKLGLWIVLPQQLVVEVGVNIVYMVTGGKSLKKFHVVICMPHCKDIKTTYFIMIFASVHLVLPQLPNFNSISGCLWPLQSCPSVIPPLLGELLLTKGGNLMCNMATKLISQQKQFSTSLAHWEKLLLPMLGTMWFWRSKQQSLLLSRSRRRKPMWKGVIVAYIIVAICYFPVALVGYWAFGESVEDNILLTLQKPRWLIAIANMMVVIHVIGSYQIYAMPVFDMIETVLVKKLHFTPGLPLRLISRSVYVAFTMFIAITFPFFGGLLGFFGGFAFAPATYFLPCIMWLAIYKPKKFSFSWITNWICIILRVLLMIIPPIGGQRQIIIQAKDYKFYS